MNISTVEESVLRDTTPGRWVIESRRSKPTSSLRLHGSNMIFWIFRPISIRESKNNTLPRNVGIRLPHDAG